MNLQISGSPVLDAVNLLGPEVANQLQSQLWSFGKAVRVEDIQRSKQIHHYQGLRRMASKQLRGRPEVSGISKKHLVRDYCSVCKSFCTRLGDNTVLWKRKRWQSSQLVRAVPPLAADVGQARWHCEALMRLMHIVVIGLRIYAIF